MDCPRKHGLSFHESCFLRRQFARNVKPMFSGTENETIKFSSAKFAQTVVKVIKLEMINLQLELYKYINTHHCWSRLADDIVLSSCKSFHGS